MNHCHALVATLSLTLVASALGACSRAPSGGGGVASSAAPSAVSTPETEPSAITHRHHRRHRRTHGGKSVPLAAQTPATRSSGTWPCDDARFASIQSRFANGTLHNDQEVDVCGTVANVASQRTTRSGPHGYYDLQLTNGSTIRIVCNLDEMNAPQWPWVKAGDYSYVQGRYYYDNASTQGIDWTHHGVSRLWPHEGYVVVAGTQYR